MFFCGSTGWQQFFDCKIFMDTKTAFVLLYRRTPIASIGFCVKKHHLLIVQLQGVFGEEKVLSVFKWERLLVAFLLDLAKALSFRKVLMNSSYQCAYNPLTNDEIETVYLPEGFEERVQRLKMRYDVTAKRMGFKQLKPGGCHVYSLSSS